MVYAVPNTDGAKVNFKEQYDNFINGCDCPKSGAV